LRHRTFLKVVNIIYTTQNWQATVPENFRTATGAPDASKDGSKIKASPPETRLSALLAMRG
jgi:hypothetical protein